MKDHGVERPLIDQVVADIRCFLTQVPLPEQSSPFTLRAVPHHYLELLVHEFGKVRGELDVALQRLAAIDAACLEVCQENNPAVVGDHAFDAERGRYVVSNEDADALIDTDDPAEVIRDLAGLWQNMSALAGTEGAESARLRASIATLKRAAAEAYELCGYWTTEEKVRLEQLLESMAGKLTGVRPDVDDALRGVI